MTLLTLVRHGQTDWNLARRIQGATDIPLNDTGRDDARRAAAELSGGYHHRVWASPLSRAHETAQIIAQSLGLAEPELHAGLRERTFGEAEGIPVEEYIEKYSTWHTTVPGSETFDEVTDRALTALEEISRESRRRAAPVAESLIVVAHGGVIRALLEHASGGSLPAEGQRILNGSLHRFVMDPDGLRCIHSYDAQSVDA
ncbi:histidine phosphatase family protein [Microbacterium sp. YY-01]|uniref:histidine phosphatase family protein n=1 Tax=Microbacterium sp. YY-01 TaxID=3421634 RepID=UPI003D162BD7